MKKKLTALGYCIFAGGFTVGVRKHFDILGHLEETDYGVATVRRNMPDVPVYVGKENWPLDELAGKVDFLYSNPPCAAWSAAGVSNHDKWKTDCRVDWARQSFNFVKLLRPRVWCWESVARAYTLGRPLVDQFTQEALALGYSVTHLLVEAARLGVPQRRNRFFMVVHDVTLDFPEPDFKMVTAGEALAGIPGEPFQKFSDNLWVSLVPDLQQGHEVRRLFNKRFPELVSAGGKKVKGRAPFQVRRINGRDVSFTLTGGATLIHPTENRYISIPESAALCGYPDNYVFEGTLSKQYAQVAQAVMPPVGSWLAGIVKKGLIKGKREGGNIRYVDLRRAPAIFVDHTKDFLEESF